MKKKLRNIKWKIGNGTILIGTAMLLLMLSITMYAANYFIVKTHAAETQMAADSLSDGVAVQASKKTQDYDVITDTADDLKNLISAETGVNITEVTIDEDQYKDNVIDTTIKTGVYYTLGKNDNSNSYTLSSESATKFIKKKVSTGGGTYSGTSDIDYVQWAIEFCNDNTHGYCSPFTSSVSSNPGNTMHNDYIYPTGTDLSCTGLVGYALMKGAGFTGVFLNPGSGYYYGLGGSFTNCLKMCGFKDIGGTSVYQEGDILIFNGGSHTGIYVGGGMIAEACADADGQMGDSSGGGEVAVNSLGNRIATSVYRMSDETLEKHIQSPAEES